MSFAYGFKPIEESIQYVFDVDGFEEHEHELLINYHSKVVIVHDDGHIDNLDVFPTNVQSFLQGIVRNNVS